ALVTRTERDMGKPDAEGRPLSHAASAGPPLRALRRARKRNDPAGAGPGVVSHGRCAYCRSPTCDLQMKATQPETSSLRPPSTSCILDLYTLPSSGLRMVPPA